jgi:hypothetical protein
MEDCGEGGRDEGEKLDFSGMTALFVESGIQPRRLQVQQKLLDPLAAWLLLLLLCIIINIIIIIFFFLSFFLSFFLCDRNQNLFRHRCLWSQPGNPTLSTRSTKIP